MAKPSIPRTCKRCGKDFLARPEQLKVGTGRFCSHSCGNHRRNIPKMLPVQRTCLRCGAAFEVHPCKLKFGRGKYCSRACTPIFNNPSLEERFWAKVRRTDTCWIWTGAKDTCGYGVISETVNGKRSSRNTHRVSYRLHYGSIPDGLRVLHHCDNPPCVRPNHLFLGTAATNNLDMAMKERSTSPLTTAQVRQIRLRYERGGITQKQLGQEFGIDKSAVCQIIKRRTWAHVD